MSDFERTHARRDGPESSRWAAKEAKSFYRSHMGRIFEVMTDRDQGWIASEIAVDSGLTEVQVGRRLSDLEERGLVVRTPDYRRNAKGNLEQVTRRTDLHPSAAVKPTRSETERLDLGKVSAQSYLSVMVGMPIRRPGTYRVYAMRIGD